MGSSPCPLLLTTMAGNEIQIVVPLSIHHNWEMLEDYLVEHLPVVSQLDTFGCELTLLHADSQHALCDPIQEELWNNTRFHLIVRDCFRSCSGKEQLQRDVYEALPKAIWVPVNDMGILPPAFFSLTRLRHVQMESGFHTIDRQAWRYCPSLRIVKLPETVVAIEYASFQGCYALEVAEMPGCVFFGVRLFSEYRALEKVGIITEKPCRLANGAVIVRLRATSVTCYYYEVRVHKPSRLRVLLSVYTCIQHTRS